MFTWGAQCALQYVSSRSFMWQFINCGGPRATRTLQMLSQGWQPRCNNNLFNLNRLHILNPTFSKIFAVKSLKIKRRSILFWWKIEPLPYQGSVRWRATQWERWGILNRRWFVEHLFARREHLDKQKLSHPPLSLALTSNSLQPEKISMETHPPQNIPGLGRGWLRGAPGREWRLFCDNQPSCHFKPDLGALPWGWISLYFSFPTVLSMCFSFATVFLFFHLVFHPPAGLSWKISQDPEEVPAARCQLDLLVFLFFFLKTFLLFESSPLSFQDPEEVPASRCQPDQWHPSSSAPQCSPGKSPPKGGQWNTLIWTRELVVEMREIIGLFI